MKGYKKEVSNKDKTIIVLITRTKLSNGYNYYLMLMTKSSNGKFFVWNEGYKQKKTILSEKEAIETAKKVV